MQVFLLARTRSLVIAMCSQQEPRRGSVVVSISFLHNHNRPSPRLDAIQCSCHQAALNRFAIFACMVFRMMRHLRCQSLLLFHFHLFYTLNALAYHNVGTCLRHVSNALIHYCLYRNMPKARALKKSKMGIFEPLETAYCASSLASAAWRQVQI